MRMLPRALSPHLWCAPPCPLASAPFAPAPVAPALPHPTHLAHPTHASHLSLPHPHPTHLTHPAHPSHPVLLPASSQTAQQRAHVVGERRLECHRPAVGWVPES